MIQSIISMEGALDRLSGLRSSSVKKIETYAKRCYKDFLNTELHKWWENERDDKDVVRSISRPFYDLVHACSIPTGLITEKAFQKKSTTSNFVLTKDHAFRPQFVNHYMWDNPEKFYDFSEFRKWFIMCCSTIFVLNEENNHLSSGGTRNDGELYSIMSPTDQQYVLANLNLYVYSDHRNWKNKTITLASNVIDAPIDLLEYEKRYLIT